MAALVWGLFVALLVLHQLDLVGDNATLVGEVLPLPLVYHAGLCVAASIVWWLVTLHAWPVDAETAAAEAASTEGDEGAGA